jgi:D-alanyl-D-alanine carboxypeptidase
LWRRSLLGDDVRTSRPNHQARAIPVRGAPRSRTRPHLRAPVTGFLLSLLVALTPDLTLAPINAGEPYSAGVQPIDQIDVSIIPRRVRPMDTAPPVPVRIAAQPAPQPVAPTVEDWSFLAAVEAARAYGGAYGVTFAAVRDGEVLWSGASGRYRDGATGLNGADSLVIGSVTKTYVAATVLQLVEEGRLNLTDTVRHYLPGEGTVTPDITIRQLLNHTSGLADVFNEQTRLGLEEHPERSWTSRELLATLHPPWYQPGEGWAYANTNYYLLGMIVERVTGSTIEAELQRRFLDPLELDATRMLGPDDPTSPLEPAWATIFWASGAMSSSAADLARWGDALYDDDVAGNALIDADAGREMLDVNGDDYGLGVKRIEVSKRTVGYGHTGLLNAYTTLLLHVPAHDVTIAMLVNRTQVDLLGMIKERPAVGGRSLLGLAVDP